MQRKDKTQCYFFKNFAQYNNHCMPHRTSSTRNDYERKINYDWPNSICNMQLFKEEV